MSCDPQVESQRRASLLAMRVADMCREYERGQRASHVQVFDGRGFVDTPPGRPNPYHELSQLPPDIVATTREVEALVGKVNEKQSVVLAGTRVFSRIDRDNWREWPAEEETHDD